MNSTTSSCIKKMILLQKCKHMQPIHHAVKTKVYILLVAPILHRICILHQSKSSLHCISPNPNPCFSWLPPLNLSFGLPAMLFFNSSPSKKKKINTSYKTRNTQEILLLWWCHPLRYLITCSGFFNILLSWLNDEHKMWHRNMNLLLLSSIEFASDNPQFSISFQI